MPYGITVVNDNNKVIIDENTGAAILTEVTGSAVRETYNQAPGFTFSGWRMPKQPNSLVCFRVPTFAEEMIPEPEWRAADGIGMTQMGFMTFRSGAGTSHPTTLPVRYVRDSRGLLGTNPYGLRVFDTNGTVVYDSQFKLLNLKQKGLIQSGQVLNNVNDGDYLCIPQFYANLRAGASRPYIWFQRLGVSQWRWVYSESSQQGPINSNTYGCYYLFSIT